MKKRFLISFTVMLLILSIAACGKEDSKSETEISSADVSSSLFVDSFSEADVTGEESYSSDVSEVQPTGEFDWDVAMDDLYILGVKIECPFSESSIGDNFIFGEESYDRFYNDVGNYLVIDVHHTDRPLLTLFSARIKETNEETYDKDSLVSVAFSMTEFSIQGITEGTPIDKVYELWGEPDTIYEHGHYGDTVVYFGKEDGQKVEVNYDHTEDHAENEVRSISIYFENMH